MNRSKTLILARVLAALLILPLAAPFAATTAPVTFTEEWEDGLDGWTTLTKNGGRALQDCGLGFSGCSLLLDPAKWDAHAGVYRTVATPLTGLSTLSFAFRGSSLTGDVDATAFFTTRGAYGLRIHLTGGSSTPNNLIDIQTDDRSKFYGDYENGFYAWPQADEWYVAAAYVDTDRDVAWVEIEDAAGVPLAASRLLTIDAAAMMVEKASFTAVSWNGYSHPFHFDSLRIGPAVLDHPLPPTAVADGGAGNVTLTWEPSPYPYDVPIVAYEVYQVLPEGSEVLLAALPQTAREFVHTGLPATTELTYRLRAVDENGAGSAPRALRAVTAGYPDAPGAIATQSGPERIRLEWNAPESDGGAPLTAYQVYAESGEGWALQAILPGDATSFTDTPVADGAERTYRVTAVNAVGEGPASEAAAGIAGGPAAPGNLAAETASYRVRLTWDEAAEPGGAPLEGYEIERRQIGTGETESFTTTATSYVDDTAHNGVTYTYRVRGGNAIAPGLWSDAVEATPNIEAPPVILVAQATPGPKVALAWQPPADTTEEVYLYFVDRKNADGEWEWLVATSSWNTAYVDHDPLPDRVNEYRVSAFYVGPRYAYWGPTSEPAVVEPFLSVGL